MKRIIAIFIFLAALNSQSQSFTKCKIYQYEGTDSSKKKLVAVKNYNAQGQVIKSYTKNWKENAMVKNADEKEFNFYKNGQLIYSCALTEDKDSTKSIYTYNAKGQPYQILHLRFSKKLKATIDKGMGGADGCVVRKKDFEKKRTWDSSSIVHFYYDSLGHQTKMKMLNLYSKDSTIFNYTYDQQHRVLSETEFNNELIHSKKLFTYGDSAFVYTVTYYDRNGQVAFLLDETKNEGPHLKYTCQLNAWGLVESTLLEMRDGEYFAKEIIVYNSDKSIQRTALYNSRGQLEITHVYAYE